MKKLNKKGFGHIEIIMIVAVFAVISLIGGFVWQNSKSKSSKAEQGYGYDYNERTVYCSYWQCYLRPGPGKAARKRWVAVSAFGYRYCQETGLIWVKSVNKPSRSTGGACLGL